MTVIQYGLPSSPQRGNMSFDPITAGLDFVGKIADKIWPDPKARQEGLIKLKELEQAGELAYLASETDLAKGQQAINLEEAKSTQLWVAGARPFFMWVCGVAFAYHYVLQPFLAFCFAATGHPVSLPAFDMEALMTVALGMLGLGGMRSFDKLKGTSK